MAHTASGTFEITMTPGPSEVDGAVSRFDFTKTFAGDLEGRGIGLMLSGGDPQAGEAGYIAIETVRGRLDGRDGGFALQQLGTMHAGSQALQCEIVPGSGLDELEGIVGTLRITVDDDGTHRYELEYDA